MEHIVRYTTSSGEDRIEDVGSLDAAIARVESLRNDEGVENPRLYREVKVEFKTYVRAQVIDDGAGGPGGDEDAGDGGADVAQPSAPRGAPEGAPVEASATDEAPEQPTATPSEPPPGAMPLSPQRPTAKVNEALEQEGDAGDGGDGEEGSGPRRTLFSRG